MKGFVELTLASVLVVVGVQSAVAQNGTPSSKATADINTLVRCHMDTAQVDDTVVLPTSCVNLFTGSGAEITENGYVTIMEKPVKLSNSQSLFVSPSLVTGLYTRTRTKTQTGGTSTAEAMGAVYLRALLIDSNGNPIYAAPLTSCNAGILGCVFNAEGWGVLLDSRIQTLTQQISACVVDVTTIPGTSDGTCTFTSTIDLIIKTASAHTFNFIFPNVGVGVYTLKIQAAVASDASVIGNGTAVGAAAFGLGSMTAESVRLVHGFEF
jgi:hypothetical protein